jgi:tetratricopeptide (TPR) repeat protein
MNPATAGRSGTFVLIGLLLAGCSSEQRQVAFQPRQPDPAQLAEQSKRDLDTLGEFKPGGQTDRVAQAFFQANLLTVSADLAEPSGLDEQMVHLRMAAKSCLIEQGQDSMIKLGLFLLAGFERELEALAKATKEVPGASTALLTGAEPPPAIRDAFGRFARYGGGFLVLAAANDLVHQGKDGGIEMSEADRFFIRLAFKVYWANAMPEAVTGIDWVLSDFERRWYEIWVVERSKTASVERKLAAIRYLEKKDPAYKAKTAAGIVLFQARQYGPAVKAFELALEADPADADAKAFLAQAKRKAR